MLSVQPSVNIQVFRHAGRTSGHGAVVTAAWAEDVVVGMNSGIEEVCWMV